MLWKATDLAGKKDIRLMALDDPDLEPLWNENIGNLSHEAGKSEYGLSLFL